MVPSTVKLRQTEKAQSERSNRVPEGGKKSQRDWSTSLKQAARAPDTDFAELRVYRDDHPSRPLPIHKNYRASLIASPTALLKPAVLLYQHSHSVQAY